MPTTTYVDDRSLAAQVRPHEGNRWSVLFTDVESGEQLPEIYIYPSLKAALDQVFRALR